MTGALASTFRGLLATMPLARNAPVAVLDIGSSKVCCYVVRLQPGQPFQLLGRGYQLAEGLRAGEIVDAEAAETSILAVIHEAEQQAGTTVREVIVAGSAGQPRSEWEQLSTDLGGRAVSEDDVRGILERARRQIAAPDRIILHLVPIEVRLDGSQPLRDPRGLSGQRLEVLVHAVTASAGPLRNITACLERCHLEVRSLVAGAYAAGHVCLDDGEKDRGCLVIDMGGGATGLSHFVRGQLALVEQVPYGGDHVTRDLAWGLSTTKQHAERIKNLFGSVQWRACDDNTRIEVPLLGDHADLPTGEVPRTRVTQIIRARIEEIFLLAQDRLREHLPLLQEHPPRSLVLTGGASQLEGVDELAQEMFGLPVRKGCPALIEGAGGVEREPSCATASGAVALAAGGPARLGAALPAEQPFLNAPISRMGRWFRDSF